MTNLSINTKRLRIPFGLAITCGLIYTLNLNLGVNWVWDTFGMMPGEPLWSRVWTLWTSQLIHGGANHLTGNISVFAPTAIYLAFKGFKFRNLYWVMPFVGLFVWTFGEDYSTHGGFSGVVFFAVTCAILEMFSQSRLKKDILGVFIKVSLSQKVSFLQTAQLSLCPLIVFCFDIGICAMLYVLT